MFTIVVELLTSLIAYFVRSLVAACCDSAPGVLTASPFTTSNGRPISITRPVVRQA